MSLSKIKKSCCFKCKNNVKLEGICLKNSGDSQICGATYCSNCITVLTISNGSLFACWLCKVRYPRADLGTLLECQGCTNLMMEISKKCSSCGYEFCEECSRQSECVNCKTNWVVKNQSISCTFCDNDLSSREQSTCSICYAPYCQECALGMEVCFSCEKSFKPAGVTDADILSLLKPLDFQNRNQL